MSSDVRIRAATEGDLGRIFAIYNQEVLHGTATFDTEPRDPEVDRDWLTARAPIHPVIVAEIEDDLAGWASLGPWSAKGAYRRTAEDSVYVEAERRGLGIGRALLDQLIALARGTEVRVILARIAEANPASVRLHEGAGFRRIGTQRRSGEKFGRLLDVELMDLHLDL